MGDTEVELNPLPSTSFASEVAVSTDSSARMSSFVTVHRDAEGEDGEDQEDSPTQTKLKKCEEGKQDRVLRSKKTGTL